MYEDAGGSVQRRLTCALRTGPPRRLTPQGVGDPPKICGGAERPPGRTLLKTPRAMMSGSFLILFEFFVFAMTGCVALAENFAAPSQVEQAVFPSKEECERKTSKVCSFQTCDYIPEEMTYEEVCGQGFRKGWVPTAS